MKHTQETISMHALLDKLLTNKVRSEQIITTITNCFSWKPILTKEDLNARKQQLSEYRKQLVKLLQIPKIDQRTEEWYNVRKGIITASEFAQALGKAKFGTQKEFYKKKCGYEEEKSLSNTCPPLKWGIMFEPVACDIYAKRTGQTIHEFGLIKHPSIPFFGASPDGITNNGIMLEIKCPFQRKITGEVPLQYYYQIQGQLSVCELDECDYLECGFHEYCELKDWLEGGDAVRNQEMGIIVERAIGEGDNVSFKYAYSPVLYANMGIEDRKKFAEEWLVTQTIEDTSDNELVTLRYWILDVYNVVRIYKDNAFLNEQFRALETIWERVCEYRNNYEVYKLNVCTSTRGSRAASMQIAQEKETSSGYMFLDD